MRITDSLNIININTIRQQGMTLPVKNVSHNCDLISSCEDREMKAETGNRAAYALEYMLGPVGLVTGDQACTIIIKL